MIKNKEEQTNNTQVMMYVYGIREAIYVASFEKEKYLENKKGITRDYTKKEVQHLKVLEFLDDNGFSMNDLGTYLYKDVICRIIDFMNKSLKPSEIIELKNQLKDAYSQFYFDIARNEKDMGLKTFHLCIQIAIENMDTKKRNLGVINKICEQKKVNYGQLAWEIASYLTISPSLTLKKEPIASSQKSNILTLTNASNLKNRLSNHKREET